jgi:hypothetical protein
MKLAEMIASLRCLATTSIFLAKNNHVSFSGVGSNVNGRSNLVRAINGGL